MDVRQLLSRSLHVDADVTAVLAALADTPDRWLDGFVRGQRVVVTLRGLAMLPSSDDPLPLLVTPGPLIRLGGAGSSLLRRLTFESDHLVPRTRCDLRATPASGHGIHLALQGEFRTAGLLEPSGGADALREAAEAAAGSLLRHIAARLTAHTPTG